MKPYFETKNGVLYHGECLDIMPNLSDIDLILADPPYFEVMGDFDFVWDSFDDYLADVRLWASECKRMLKENGTLYWFGSSKNIAYAQVIFDKHFGLINNLVWEKTEGGLYGTTNSEKMRSFPNSTERILMYGNDVYNLTQCVYTIRDYIREEIMKARGKIVFKEINEAFGTATNGGGVASACLSLNKSEPTMLTKEMYVKLQQWLNESKEYKYLRKEYEELRRPFSNVSKSTEIIKVMFEGNDYKHDTVKPLKLINILMQTSSKSNDLILDPFFGSGTTGVACERFNRKWIGIEKEEKYCEIAAKRIDNEIQQGKLF